MKLNFPNKYEWFNFYDVATDNAKCIPIVPLKGINAIISTSYNIFHRDLAYIVW